MIKLLPYIISAMSGDYDYLSDISGAQIVDHSFNYRLVAEAEERFESAHPSRAAGGEHNGRNMVFGFWTLDFGFRFVATH